MHPPHENPLRRLAQGRGEYYTVVMRTALLVLAIVWIQAAFGADGSALPPPTSVSGAPEAKETVPPEPSSAAPVTDQGGDAAGETELHVYRREDGAIVEEHSLRGHVYMIRVQPAGNLPAYYLYDSDGDGTFERRLPGDYKHIAPPMWVIKRF